MVLALMDQYVKGREDDCGRHGPAGLRFPNLARYDPSGGDLSHIEVDTGVLRPLSTHIAVTTSVSINGHLPAATMI